MTAVDVTLRVPVRRSRPCLHTVASGPDAGRAAASTRIRRMRAVVGFAFGPCLLDTRARQLTRGGERVDLSPLSVPTSSTCSCSHAGVGAVERRPDPRRVARHCRGGQQPRETDRSAAPAPRRGRSGPVHQDRAAARVPVRRARHPCPRTRRPSRTWSCCWRRIGPGPKAAPPWSRSNAIGSARPGPRSSDCSSSTRVRRRTTSAWPTPA